MGWTVRMNGKGRILIPSEVRNRLGLRKGRILSVDIVDSKIVLTMLETEAVEDSGHNELRSFLSRQ